MMRTFIHNNKLTLVIALAALVILPLLAVFASSSHSQGGSAAESEVTGVTYPRNYQQDFTRYATVQRPDGTIRDLYINDIGLAAVRVRFVLPPGTVIVSEGYDALQDAQGNYVTDASGHYVKGDPMAFVHVREKRLYWSAVGFTSDARNGGWNFGSFDTKTGAVYDESLNACFLCHNTAPADFTYSVEPMRDFALTGEAVYFMCQTTGRTACE